MSPIAILSALGALKLQATVARNRYQIGSPIWEYQDGRVFAYQHAIEAVRALMEADKQPAQKEVSR